MFEYVPQMLFLLLMIIRIVSDLVKLINSIGIYGLWSSGEETGQFIGEVVILFLVYIGGFFDIGVIN